MVITRIGLCLTSLFTTAITTTTTTTPAFLVGKSSFDRIHDMPVPSTRTQLGHVAAPAIWNALLDHHPLVVDSLELG